MEISERDEKYAGWSLDGKMWDNDVLPRVDLSAQ